MYTFNSISSFFLAIILISCSNGYEQSGGTWTYVTYDEAAGKRSLPIEGYSEPFTPIDNAYATDKYNVYFKGRIIEGADPGTFELIDKGYSRDENHVFLDQYQISMANPQTFELLEWPYSRDTRFLFCGTIPIPVMNPKEFVVIETSTERTAIKNSELLKINSTNRLLDSLSMNVVIYGSGKGETKNERIVNFELIE